MLRIPREGTEVPSVLLSDEAEQARVALVRHLRLAPDARDQRRPPVNDRLFRNTMIVKALRRLFRDKCAYCEAAVQHGEEEVDHFRPLRCTAVTGREADRDHYVWLAYEWQNLNLSCGVCSKSKGGRFPVLGERARLLATWHEADTQERRLLLDPTHDDPWRDLPMMADGICRPTTRRGETTVSIFDLNRPSLIDRRREDVLRLQAFFSEAVYTGRLEQASLLFDPSREFLSSRLHVLHRVLSHRVPQYLRRPVAQQALPELFLQIVREASASDRRLLVESFEAVVSESGEGSPADGTRRQMPKSDGSVVPPRSVGGSAHSVPDREISRIHIAGFRGIDRLVLQFPRSVDRRRKLPCLMLLGENSAGKSSTLEAIALTLLGVAGTLKLRIPPSELLQRDDPEGWNVLDPADPNVTVFFLDEDPPATLRVTNRGRTFEGTDAPSVLVLAYGASRHFSNRSSRSRRAPDGMVRNLFERNRSLPGVERWLLESSRDRDRFNAVARALREILALDDSDELILDDVGRPSVRVLGRPVPVERLSEGYRSLFFLSVDIMRNLLAYWPDLETARAVVLIDEIESHLHPRWKMRVLSALRRAFPGVQFIVSTHDPLCLRGMEDGEVVVIERDKEGRVHVLEDLPSIRGMSAEQILTSEYFGLFSTADPEMELDFARLAGFEGRRSGSASLRDEELIERIVLGDTIRQQLIHEALDHYLLAREQRRGNVEARREAVQAVLDVLDDDRERGR